MNKPKRLVDAISTKSPASRTKNDTNGGSKKPKFPEPEKFELPNFKLDLEFFIKKGDQPFSVDSLISMALGEKGTRLTEPEQVYVILNAMSDLEVVAPLEFVCPHCEKENPVAIELAKVMKLEGDSLENFYIEYKNYMFKFERPQIIQHISNVSSPVATIGLFMIQWLSEHNQGESFDILKMNIRDFVEISKLFAEKMQGVIFSSKVKCAHCKKHFESEFTVTVEDLCAILNEV